MVKNQEKEYRIEYNFNGSGVCYVKAKSEEEARDMFYDGEYEGGEEDTSDYEIYDINDTND